MKLFDGFEAIKFPQEDLILITYMKHIIYVYYIEDGYWIKCRNAGYRAIKVENYEDVTRKDLMDAMNGAFPNKETDFSRLCDPQQLYICDMMDLLNEDYTCYMSDGEIYHTVHNFLLESNICYRSYIELKKLLDSAIESDQENNLVCERIKELSLGIIGRDIFKNEIRIVDGHDGSSYFWINPVRVIDYSDTAMWDNVAEMISARISIEEDDVFCYLMPFLNKYFTDDLEANKKRLDYNCADEDGNATVSSIKGFEWYLTHNFFTYEAIAAILNDIRKTVDVLAAGKDNEFSVNLNNDTDPEIIIDFYNRFIYRMEYMLKVGKENGYNLISFMGP